MWIFLEQLAKLYIVHAFGSAIFRRDCVTCPNSLNTVCSCPSGQICSLSLQTCTSCPAAKCISLNGENPSNNSGGSSKKSNAGPVAGGVIGGFVVLGILGFFLWRSMNKKRREKQLAAEKEASFGSSRAARVMTRHTPMVVSILNTNMFIDIYSHRCLYFVHYYSGLQCHPNWLPAWRYEPICAADTRPIYSPSTPSSWQWYSRNSLPAIPRSWHFFFCR